MEFDDLTITHTKSNVVQYNEYYPFGMQAQRSWTRENSKNNFLGNGGSELNPNSGWYETFFRGFDPTLGRFMQIDPKAGLYMDLTPYNFAGNDPVLYNDPLGDRRYMAPDDPRLDPGYRPSGSPSEGGGMGGFDIGMIQSGMWAMDAVGNYYDAQMDQLQAFSMAMAGIQSGVTGAAEALVSMSGGSAETYYGQDAANFLFGEGYRVIENPILVTAVQGALAAGMSHGEIRLTIEQAEQNVDAMAQIMIRLWYLNQNMVASSNKMAGIISLGDGGILQILRFKQYDDDIGDGTRRVGLYVAFLYTPSQEEKSSYSKFNVTLTGNDKHVVSGACYRNNGPFFYCDGENYSGFQTVWGEFSDRVGKNYSATFSGQAQFFGWSGSRWVSLATVDFGYTFNNNSFYSYGPTVVPPTYWSNLSPD